MSLCLTRQSHYTISKELSTDNLQGGSMLVERKTVVLPESLAKRVQQHLLTSRESFSAYINRLLETALPHKKSS